MKTLQLRSDLNDQLQKGCTRDSSNVDNYGGAVRVATSLVHLLERVYVLDSLVECMVTLERDDHKCWAVPDGMAN